MSWTFTPKTDGTYTFNGQSVKDGQTQTCTASVRVGKAKAACAIDVRVDPDTNIISVDSSRTKGDFELTGLTLPDGTAGDMAMIESTGDSTWTYDPSGTLKRKPADYNYTFAGKSTLYGTESTCDTSAVIRIEGAEYAWIARGYWLHNNPGSDTLHVENPQGFDPPIFTQFWADGGNGFGGEVEYMFRPALGIWGGVAFSNIKTSLMYDRVRCLADRYRQSRSAAVQPGWELSLHAEHARRHLRWRPGLVGQLQLVDLQLQRGGPGLSGQVRRRVVGWPQSRYRLPVQGRKPLGVLRRTAVHVLGVGGEFQRLPHHHRSAAGLPRHRLSLVDFLLEVKCRCTSGCSGFFGLRQNFPEPKPYSEKKSRILR